MFTATVVLPTPPLPLAMATRFFTPGMGWRGGIGCGAGAGGIRLFSYLPFSGTWGAAVLRPCSGKIMCWRRGISCISCRSRRDRDRCGLLWRRRGRAWALPLAPGRSDTADLFAGAAGGARSVWRLRVGVAARFRWRARRRWLRRLARPRLAMLVRVAVPDGFAFRRDVFPLAASGCDRGSEWFRCR